MPDSPVSPILLGCMSLSPADQESVLLDLRSLLRIWSGGPHRWFKAGAGPDGVEWNFDDADPDVDPCCLLSERGLWSPAPALIAQALGFSSSLEAGLWNDHKDTTFEMARDRVSEAVRELERCLST